MRRCASTFLRESARYSLPQIPSTDIPMNADAPLTEYLVISRGQWDPSASKEDIQRAIDAFYAWHEGMVAQGRSKRGSRLMKDGKFVSRRGVVDGPYSEAKEVIGGYWSVYAHSLDEAAQL